MKAISNVKSDSDVGLNDSQTDEVLREWRESAFYWQKHADTIRTMFGSITQTLIEDAEIVEGDVVLDVAGGAGEPSLTIADIVGLRGSVICTDVTAEMVAAAQSEAQRHGVTNIAFRQCAADSLPFENNSFDAVVCRLGVMFFPDPLAGLCEMLRVAKREGVLSLAVWDKGELNPFSYLITDVLDRHFGAATPADPNAPGAFRFAEHGSLARILAEAGAVDVIERVLKFQIAAPISSEQFWELRSETSGTLREKLATLSPVQADLVAQEAQEAVELVNDLSDEQLIGPRLPIVNPLLWEIGHLAWFQGFWVLRHLGGQPPILTHGDELYDSARVAHDTRWDLPLLERDETLAYMQRVLERVINLVGDETGLTDSEGYNQDYFLNLVLLHEQMHDEAIAYTRQTLSYPAPKIAVVNKVRPAEQDRPLSRTADCLTGDAQIPDGKFTLGNAAKEGFVFDNERLAHEVEIAPFAISKTAVSNGEFQDFVEDGGYKRSGLWSAEGWHWRTAVMAEHPVYWQQEGNGRWLRRNFDEWVALDERLPVIHVNWHGANAYCRWANRRLPTEAEWEMTASAEPSGNGLDLSEHKRAFPWGDDSPTLKHANPDWRALGCVPVDALPLGDGAFGCRQMIGNAWEWTASDFLPYPGFIAGPYKEYSEPWFGNHKVLRGGCWITRSRLIHNSYRNFYTPDRRDVWAGFRTCGLQN